MTAGRYDWAAERAVSGFFGPVSAYRAHIVAVVVADMEMAARLSGRGEDGAFIDDLALIRRRYGDPEVDLVRDVYRELRQADADELDATLDYLRTALREGPLR